MVETVSPKTWKTFLRRLFRLKPKEVASATPTPPPPTPNQVADTLILLLKNLLTKGETGKGKGKVLPETASIEQILKTTLPQPTLPEPPSLEEAVLTPRLIRVKKSYTKKEIQSILDLLDERLAYGEINEKTYLKARSRWEKRLKKRPVKRKTKRKRRAKT